MVEEDIIVQVSRAAESDEHVPLRIVRRWLESEDIESLGSAYSFIVDNHQRRHITPRLRIEELEEFVFRFYHMCLKEDLEGEWALTRYGAARELIGWFTAAPRRLVGVSRRFLLDLKEWMARRLCGIGY